jgi:hypothetical protein
MMSDMGDLYKDWEKAKKAKKRSNLAYSTKILREKGISFDSKNDGVHLIIKSNGISIIDFWPSTGKYINRRSRKEGRGVRNLIKELENYSNQTGER